MENWAWYICAAILRQENARCAQDIDRMEWVGGLDAHSDGRSHCSADQASALGHLVDCGLIDDGGTAFLVRQFYRGIGIFSSATEERDCDDVLISIDRDMPRASFLHTHSIVHRRLKPSNVILVGEKDHGSEPKLLDFGLSLMPKKSRRDRITLAYTAPEVLFRASKPIHGPICIRWVSWHINS